MLPLDLIITSISLISKVTYPVLSRTDLILIGSYAILIG